MKHISTTWWSSYAWFLACIVAFLWAGDAHAPWWVTGIMGLVAGTGMSLSLRYLEWSARLDGRLEENGWQRQLWSKALGHPEAESWEMLMDLVNQDAVHNLSAVQN